MGWKSLTAWGVAGVYIGCKAAIAVHSFAPVAPSPSNFDAYHRYVEQPQPQYASSSTPETSPDAEYILGLPRVAMPYIPRSYGGPILFPYKGAGKRGTLTKSTRFSRTMGRRSAAPRENVLRSSRSRVAKAALNYGVESYGFR